MKNVFLTSLFIITCFCFAFTQNEMSKKNSALGLKVGFFNQQILLFRNQQSRIEPKFDLIKTFDVEYSLKIKSKLWLSSGIGFMIDITKRNVSNLTLIDSGPVVPDIANPNTFEPVHYTTRSKLIKIPIHLRGYFSISKFRLFYETGISLFINKSYKTKIIMENSFGDSMVSNIQNNSQLPFHYFGTIDNGLGIEFLCFKKHNLAFQFNYNIDLLGQKLSVFSERIRRSHMGCLLSYRYYL